MAIKNPYAPPTEGLEYMFDIFGKSRDGFNKFFDTYNEPKTFAVIAPKRNVVDMECSVEVGVPAIKRKYEKTEVANGN